MNNSCNHIYLEQIKFILHKIENSCLKSSCLDGWDSQLRLTGWGQEGQSAAGAELDKGCKK